MRLPVCLDPDWRIVNPDWDTRRRFVEVILHGTGVLTVWRGNHLHAYVPFRKRIWVDAVACQIIGDTPGIYITKLRECDELPQ